MKKTITLLVLLLFFCGGIPVFAEGGEIEGDIGLDWFEPYDNDLDIDIDHNVGGGGDSNDAGFVNENLIARTTGGSEIIKHMQNNPTGLKKTQSTPSHLSIYKLNGQGYVLECLESDAKDLNYSILSVLGTNLISNRSLQAATTVLETQGLPSGAYLVVVRKGTQVQKVFKIIH